MTSDNYTEPPTPEFKHKKEDGIHNGVLGWLTLQKSVMNDYYFDAANTDWITEDLDNFMWKIYYCWQEATEQLVQQIQGGLID